MLCCMPGVAFVPALLVSWSSAAFIISYAIAVLAGHVEPLVPYISDTGTKPPESGIFGFMINISALLGFSVKLYWKYLRFVFIYSHLVPLMVSLLSSIISCKEIFVTLFASSVHDIGALVAFGSGVVYITLQSIISYKSCPQWNTYFVCHIRMAISVISCIAFIPSILYAVLSESLFYVSFHQDYTYHLVSAICEWTVAFGFIFFFLTFIRDFQ
ncbi:DRAM1 protein, partial [Nyctiprogne leucopyga]|nr:DRAM1 protein [Nyctiprogne leucopyga]